LISLRPLAGPATAQQLAKCPHLGGRTSAPARHDDDQYIKDTISPRRAAAPEHLTIDRTEVRHDRNFGEDNNEQRHKQLA
jgi:hypothetical protein